MTVSIEGGAANAANAANAIPAITPNHAAQVKSHEACEGIAVLTRAFLHSGIEPSLTGSRRHHDRMKLRASPPDGEDRSHFAKTKLCYFGRPHIANRCGGARCRLSLRMCAVTL